MTRKLTCAVSYVILGYVFGMVWPSPLPATVGWGQADMVLDFGVTVAAGETYPLLNEFELDNPVDVEVMWKLDPRTCLVKVKKGHPPTESGMWEVVGDDRTLQGTPSHADLAGMRALVLVASPTAPCRIDATINDFILVAEKASPEVVPAEAKVPARLGATVMVLRATSFFTPKVVTVKAGQRVVWLYADGSKEPHSVTSGECETLDCSGGGKQFDSGPTMNKPGRRFEHTFKRPGVVPYHCKFHTSNMRGIVIVVP